jgi:hypothetical protein
MMKTIAITLWMLGVAGHFTIAANKAYDANRNRITFLAPPPLSGFKEPIINILTLGQKNLYDDFIDIWLVQILADPKAKTANIDELNKTILQVTDLHPKIESIYMLSCFILGIDLNRPDFCEKIILNGLNAFPNSWRLPMTQGFMYGFKLNDPVKAAAFYDLASSRQESPPYVASLAKKMLNKEPLTEGDAKEALEVMLKVPGGSRFTEFLEQNTKNRMEPNKE